MQHDDDPTSDVSRWPEFLNTQESDTAQAVYDAATELLIDEAPLRPLVLRLTTGELQAVALLTLEPYVSDTMDAFQEELISRPVGSDGIIPHDDSGSPDYLRPRRYGPGFQRMLPLNDEYGGTIRVGESSSAALARVVLIVEQEDADVVVELAAETAWRLSEQLQVIVRRHYQGDATPRWAR
jgi:hypothetical protein